MGHQSEPTKRRIVTLNYQSPTQRKDMCIRCTHSKPVSDGRQFIGLRCTVLKDNVAKFGRCDAWAADVAANQPTEDTREPKPL